MFNNFLIIDNDNVLIIQTFRKQHVNKAEEYSLTFVSPRLYVHIWKMEPGLAR